MIIKYEVKWSNECVTDCPHKQLNRLNNIIRVGTEDCEKCPFFVRDVNKREIECGLEEKK